MGVLLVLEYGIAASTVAVGWSGYVASFLHDLGVDIAHGSARGARARRSPTLRDGEQIGVGVVNLPAIVAIAAVTGLLVLGVSESAFVNNIVVAIKVTVVVAFIAIGAFYVNPTSGRRWCRRPYLRRSTRTRGYGARSARLCGPSMTAQNTGQYGVPGIITAAATIFFAYIGFEAVSTAGAESRNPSRDMPIGIIGSLIVCTILYILTSAVLVGIVPYTDSNDPAPIAKAVNQIGLPWFAVLVKIGAIAGLSSVMLVLLYGQTRIFYTMARDGLIPPVFAQVHPKFKTPWINTLIVGVLACGFAGFMGLDALANLTNVGTLLAFAIVCVTVDLSSLRASRHAPAVQDAAVSGHAAPRRRDVLVPADVVDGPRSHAQFLPRLSRRRHPALFRVRHVELEARQGRCRARPRSNGRVASSQDLRSIARSEAMQPDEPRARKAVKWNSC